MPYTLLLADDSVTIQRVIELTFADEDVTVVAVSDGDQAIERLEAWPPPDIVLADIGMPGKNGYEVAQYIRQSPKLSHIPVVLLTGAFEPVDQARANEAGCDGVLAKPFEPQLVISRVKELLARSRRSPEASESHPPFAEGQDFSLPPLLTPSTAGGDSIPESMWSPPQLDQRPVTPFVDPPMAAAQTGPVPRTELNDYFDRLDAAFSTLSGAPAASPAPANPTADPAAAPPAAELDWFENLNAGTGSNEPWDLPKQPDASFPVGAPEPEPELVHESLTATVAPADAEDNARLVAERVAEAARYERPEETPVVPVQPEPFDDFVASVAPVPHPLAFEHDVPVTPPVTLPAAAPLLEIPLPNPPPLPALADAFAALLAAEQGEPVSVSASLWPASAPHAAAAPVVTEELIEDVARRVLERLSDTVVREAVADVASRVAERLVLEEIARIKASIK